MLRRAYHRTIGGCEPQFLALTSLVSGFRIERTWLVPAWYDRSLLKRAVRSVSHLFIESAAHDRFILRLDRNCWDYELIHPKREVLEVPQVTVLLTTYNAEAVVRRALDSVGVCHRWAFADIHQPRKPWVSSIAESWIGGCERKYCSPIGCG
jgi:hypothetical protein